MKSIMHALAALALITSVSFAQIPTLYDGIGREISPLTYLECGVTWVDAGQTGYVGADFYGVRAFFVTEKGKMHPISTIGRYCVPYWCDHVHVVTRKYNRLTGLWEPHNVTRWYTRR